MIIILCVVREFVVSEVCIVKDPLFFLLSFVFSWEPPLAVWGVCLGRFLIDAGPS